jgi:arylsulfatase
VVDREYHDKAPYAFTGTVKKVTFDLKPAPIEVEKRLHEATQVSAMGTGAGA